MTTFADVHRAIDEYTVSALAGENVVYSNQDDNALSQGTAPYVKQRVLFTQARQFELGAPERGRNYGVVVFLIHVRRGQGEAARNTLLQKVVNSFRSRVIGAATLLNARMTTQGENANWSLTGVEVPFYYHDL